MDSPVSIDALATACINGTNAFKKKLLCFKDFQNIKRDLFFLFSTMKPSCNDVR